MNADEWREVKQVLRQAIALPHEQRVAFIDVACHDNATLRQEVVSLLAAFDAEADDAAEFHDPREALRSALDTALGARFEILGALGHGGMGSVFLAHERELGRTVAIKVLRPDRASTPGSRERFRREARIAAQLSHVGIVPLHSFGEENGLWYFVMEYVRGPSLAQRLDLEGRLPPDAASDILLAIADAVAHAHQHGVIHRDIKPANILLDDVAGRARLADFGISKVEGSADDITATGVVVGTPHYMSPEQADGSSDVDVRSDVYSLGAVAYAMLTGKPPFPGDDVRDVLARRRSEDPVPITTLAPRVPVELARIVMRCLARDREERWRDAATLAQALRSSGAARASELPQEIADLPGYAAYGMAWLVFWTTIAFTAAHSIPSRSLLLLLAVLVPVGPALHLWRLRAHGVSASQFVRMMLRPPRWWGIWWPAQLRRPDDLWPRLPPFARNIRKVLALTFFLLLVVAVASDSTGTPARWARNVAGALLVLGVPVAVVLLVRWTLRHALGFDRTMQFLFSSTTPSEFWQEPVVQRLLASPAQSVRAPDADNAVDHLRAIEALIAHYPQALESLRIVAVRAAQQRCARLVRTEHELSVLDRDASPFEVNRLTTRLAQLTGSGIDTPDHRELTESVRRQLDVVRRMQGQRTLGLARRDEQFALLRALWSQVALVVEAERAGAGVHDDAVRRASALCARLLMDDQAPPGTPKSASLQASPGLHPPNAKGAVSRT